MLCLLDKQSERKREKEWTTDFESEGREFESSERATDARHSRRRYPTTGGSECLQLEAQKLKIPRSTIAQPESGDRLLPNCFGLRRPVRLKTSNKTYNKTSNTGESHA
jgi:hypothetical protein